MLKTKKGMLLRQLKNQNFVVPVGDMVNEFRGMIRLNEVGAYYWKEMEKGISREDLLAKAQREFPEVEAAVLAADLDDFLSRIRIAIEDV